MNDCDGCSKLIMKLSAPSQQFLESALLWKCICLDEACSVKEVLSTDEDLPVPHAIMNEVLRPANHAGLMLNEHKLIDTHTHKLCRLILKSFSGYLAIHHA